MNIPTNEEQMMRCFRLLMITGLLLASAAWAGTPIVPHQGRLLDASDAPVSDGVHTLTFRIFTMSGGGNAIWSEARDVTTTDGLYSTELGTVSSLAAIFPQHANDELYLEIEVAGTVLLPRLRLGSVPYAVTSSSVRRGHYSVPLGEDLNVGLSVADDGAELDLGSDTDADGTRNVRSNVRVASGAVSVAHTIDRDNDGTGDQGIEMLSSDGSSLAAGFGAAIEPRSILKTYFETGDIPTQEQFSSLSTTGTSSSISSGSSLQGTVRTSSSLSATPSSSSAVVAADLDGDGAAEYSTGGSADASTSQWAVLKKGGGGGGGNTTDGWQMLCAIDGTDETTEVGDQSAGSVASMRTRIDQLESKLQAIGLLGRSSATTFVTPDSATLAVSKLQLPTGNAQEGVLITALEGRAGVEVTVRDALGNRKGNVGINSTIPDTKLHVSRPASDPLGGEVIDDIVLSTSETSNDFTMTRRSGLPPGEPYIGSIALHTEPTLSSIALGDLDRDGRLDLVCNSDSATSELSFSPPGVTPGVYLMKAKEKANRTKCSSNLRYMAPGSDNEVDHASDSTSASSSWSSANTSAGTSSSLTIQVSTDPLVDPIVHSSGAKLTASGTWLSVSDVDAKENFEPVDGGAVLEKIEQLPITEWNYRLDGQEIRHIGPTAQDFRAAFGLGEDEKTIATMDPSGVALAAIKELSRQNQELRQQNADLQKQFDELRQKLDKLSVSR